MYLLYSMKKVSRLVLVALLVSVLVDLAGFTFGLFYAGVFYDNLAHFLTTFSLVALVSELYLRYEMTHHGTRRQVTFRQALAVGAAASLLGGAAWECFEVLLDLAFPETIYNPPVDSVVDTAFGILGGSVGVLRTVAHFGLAPSRKSI